VAVEAGYYDQSHMIDEFHALVGTTPASLVSEMRRQLDKESTIQGK
jgi:AraC-like DNA-binding protein